MHGYVLTNGGTVDILYDLLRKDNVDILKLIPTWGLPYNDEIIARLLAATKDTIIRTTHGDPARNEGRTIAKDGNDYRYIIPESLFTLDRFLRVKPHCYIELGNEPNIETMTENHIWVYRYWLQDAIGRLRSKYRYAKLISTAPIVTPEHRENAELFYKICGDVLNLCDYSGIHAYAHKDFDDDLQLHFAKGFSIKYLPDKPMMLTEYGINDKDTPVKEKLKRYKKLRDKNKNIAAFCIFHINEVKDIYPQYSVTRKDIV